MNTIITLVLALAIIAVLFALFLQLKTPYYRVDKEKMIRVVEMVLTGQATDNDWQMVFGMTIRHNPELEAIRQQCLEVEEKFYIGEQRPPYLFSTEGLEVLDQILTELKSID